jgi:DNA-binding CsgD family transcriptional regulator
MKIPEWIHPEAWESLTNREKDFMRMVAKGGYTKDDICRFLYIESDVTYWRIRGRIKEKISL